MARIAALNSVLPKDFDVRQWNTKLRLVINSLNPYLILFYSFSRTIIPAFFQQGVSAMSLSGFFGRGGLTGCVSYC